MTVPATSSSGSQKRMGRMRAMGWFGARIDERGWMKTRIEEIGKRNSQKALNQPQGAEGKIDQLDAHKRSHHAPETEHQEIAPEQLFGTDRPELHPLER